MISTLALDTSTPRAYLAILREDGQSFARTIEPGMRHGRELIPSIRDLLREAGLKPSDLGMIRVGVGPGSYTGLRVGVTAAKTLAYATGAGLATFNSLEFFALGAPSEALRVVTISDAQRGDFHVAEFRRDSPGATLVAHEATTIEDRTALSIRLSDAVGPAHVVGPGLDRWDGEWPDGTVPSPDCLPSPILMMQIERGLTTLDRAALDGLEPVYLRRSAAEDQWEKRST